MGNKQCCVPLQRTLGSTAHTRSSSAFAPRSTLGDQFDLVNNTSTGKLPESNTRLDEIKAKHINRLSCAMKKRKAVVPRKDYALNKVCLSPDKSQNQIGEKTRDTIEQERKRISNENQILEDQEQPTNNEVNQSADYDQQRMNCIRPTNGNGQQTQREDYRIEFEQPPITQADNLRDNEEDKIKEPQIINKKNLPASPSSHQPKRGEPSQSDTQRFNSPSQIIHHSQSLEPENKRSSSRKKSLFQRRKQPQSIERNTDNSNVDDEQRNNLQFNIELIAPENEDDLIDNSDQQSVRYIESHRKHCSSDCLQVQKSSNEQQKNLPSIGISQEWILNSLQNKQQTFKSSDNKSSSNTQALNEGGMFSSEGDFEGIRKEPIHQFFDKPMGPSPRRSHILATHMPGLLNNGPSTAFDLTLHKINLRKNPGSCLTSGRMQSGTSIRHFKSIGDAGGVGGPIGFFKYDSISSNKMSVIGFGGQQQHEIDGVATAARLNESQELEEINRLHSLQFIGGPQHFHDEDTQSSQAPHFNKNYQNTVNFDNTDPLLTPPIENKKYNANFNIDQRVNSVSSIGAVSFCGAGAGAFRHKHPFGSESEFTKKPTGRFQNNSLGSSNICSLHDSTLRQIQDPQEYKMFAEILTKNGHAENMDKECFAQFVQDYMIQRTHSQQNCEQATSPVLGMLKSFKQHQQDDFGDHQISRGISSMVEEDDGEDSAKLSEVNQSNFLKPTNVKQTKEQKKNSLKIDIAPCNLDALLLSPRKEDSAEPDKEVKISQETETYDKILDKKEIDGILDLIMPVKKYSSSVIIQEENLQKESIQPTSQFERNTFNFKDVDEISPIMSRLQGIETEQTPPLTTGPLLDAIRKRRKQFCEENKESKSEKQIISTINTNPKTEEQKKIKLNKGLSMLADGEAQIMKQRNQRDSKQLTESDLNNGQLFHASLPLLKRNTSQNLLDSLKQRPEQNRSRCLLRPLKQLAQKLNNNHQQLEDLLNKRKEAIIKNEIQSLVKMSSLKDDLQKIESFLQNQVPSRPSSQSNTYRFLHPENHTTKSKEDAKTDEDDTIKNLQKFPLPSRQQMITSGSKTNKAGESESQYLRSSGMQSHSPLLIKMKSSELSPLVETIEISESQFRGVMNGTDKTSEISYTPSEFRNVSQFIGPDVSVQYSVLEQVEFDNSQTHSQISYSKENYNSAKQGHFRTQTNSYATTPVSRQGKLGNQLQRSYYNPLINNSSQVPQNQIELTKSTSAVIFKNPKIQMDSAPIPACNTPFSCEDESTSIKQKQHDDTVETPNSKSRMPPVPSNISNFNTNPPAHHAKNLSINNQYLHRSHNALPPLPLPTQNTASNTAAEQDATSRSKISVISKSVISTTKQRDGKKKINQYIVMKEIGKGSFGKVKLVLNSEENNKAYAMKTLSKQKLNRIFVGKKRTAMQDVMQEIAIMKKLDHENVVRLYEVLDDPSVDKLYIIMEYVKNGSVMSKVTKSKNLQPSAIWKYFRDILQGIHYLHECVGVIHRDLKPENLLIDENDNIKISDFGVSYIVENGCDEIQSTAGSNYFFSPEICAGKAYKGKKSDIWALGVTLYFAIFKKYPFNASLYPVLYNKILTEEPDYPTDCSPLLVDLIKKMLIKDPDERISLQEIVVHDWVTCNGLQPLPIHLYPGIQVKPQDASMAIKKVSLIAKIRIKIRQKVNDQKQRRQIQQLSQNQVSLKSFEQQIESKTSS